jgi:putative glutamine amidotransferase
MARPPLIIVSPGIEKRGAEFHDLSISLSVKYENVVLQAGGLPVTTPTTTDRPMLAEIVRLADGVMLTGGDDIHPDLYDRHLPAAVRQTIGATPDGGRRDLRELILIDETFRQRKPLLAICRGHQLLNIALGGRLIADIRHQVPGALDHQRLDKAGELVHEVPLTTGSLLARMTRKRFLGINSSHHQGVMEPAEPLVAVARTQDGIVEAMEWKPETARRMPFLLSIQFHPERLTGRHAEHRAIFRWFVEVCGRRSKT